MIWGTNYMETSILGTENIGKLFLRYSVPTIAAMLFLGLNTIVDGFFVGRYDDSACCRANSRCAYWNIAV